MIMQLHIHTLQEVLHDSLTSSCHVHENAPLAPLTSMHQVSESASMPGSIPQDALCWTHMQALCHDDACVESTLCTMGYSSACMSAQQQLARAEPESI